MQRSREDAMDAERELARGNVRLGLALLGLFLLLVAGTVAVVVVYLSL